MKNNKNKYDNNLIQKEMNLIFAVNGEAISNCGEDAFSYCTKEDGVLLSVFDGCGGSGSRKYKNYSYKTGAFVASRAVCGSVSLWYKENKSYDAKSLHKYISRALSVCKRFAGEESRISSDMIKEFPTTAAVVCAEAYEGGLELNCFWAGDSRCYVLDKKGLHQISNDDIGDVDAFENIGMDKALENVISAGGEFNINHKTVKVDFPCMIFTATDGCFSYFPSPMAFECFLTEKLVSSENVYEWKEALQKGFAEYAGDDYTMCIAGFGFNSFTIMKKMFEERYDFLKNHCTEKDSESLWKIYKESYYL